MAVLCGLFITAAVGAGVYSAGEQPRGVFADEKGVEPMPLSVFRDMLLDRIGLLSDPSKLRFGDPPLPEGTLKRRKDQEAKAAAIQTKIASGRPVLEDQIDLSALLISLGKYQEAINLLEPLARGEGQTNFMVLSNLATASQLSAHTLERVPGYLEQADRSWPKKVPNISDPQLAFFRECEKYQRRLVQLREAEIARQPVGARLHPEGVDALFGEPGDPVRFVGESGKYEAGGIAAKEKAKLPANAIPIVQQLALWLPNDTRLYWLLAELLNADGQVSDALSIMDECIGAGRRYDSIELKDHRRVLKDWTPPAPPPPPVLPDRKKLFIVGGFVVVVIGLLGYFQLRELLRRRFAGNGH
jgi:hypothetical protein